MAPVPGWGRIGFLPESDLLFPGKLLGLAVAALIGGRLLFPVFLVPPGHTRPELLKIGVASIDLDFANDPLIAVRFIPLYGDRAVEDQAGQMLLGALAIRLLFLRRVDSGQAYLVLLVGSVQDGDRIAVGDRDDTASQLIGAGARDDQGEQEADVADHRRLPSFWRQRG